MITANTPWYVEVAGDNVSRIKDREGNLIGHMTHREADLVIEEKQYLVILEDEIERLNSVITDLEEHIRMIEIDK